MTEYLPQVLTEVEMRLQLVWDTAEYTIWHIQIC